MAQLVVTSFYQAKKRFKNPGKSAKTAENQKLSSTVYDEETLSASESIEPKLKITENAASTKPSRTRRTKNNVNTEATKSKNVSSRAKSAKTGKSCATSERGKCESELSTGNSCSEPKSKKPTAGTCPVPDKSNSQETAASAGSDEVGSTSCCLGKTAKTSSSSELVEATKVTKISSSSEPVKSKASKRDGKSKATKLKNCSESAKSKSVEKSTKGSVKSKAKQSKVTSYLEAPSQKSNSTSDVVENDSKPVVKPVLEGGPSGNKPGLPRSPSKRNLPIPDEGTPAKKSAVTNLEPLVPQLTISACSETEKSKETTISTSLVADKLNSQDVTASTSSKPAKSKDAMTRPHSELAKSKVSRAKTSSETGKSKAVKGRGKTKAQQNKVTSYLKAPAEKSNSSSEIEENNLKAVEEPITEVATKPDPPQTPSKRNLPTPDEATPSKRRVLQEDVTTPKSSTKKVLNVTFSVSPIKTDGNARRKLVMDTPCVSRLASPRKMKSPMKSSISPQKAASYGNLKDEELTSLVNESRSKILFSTRLDDLKKSLAKFSKLSSQVKDYQSNSFKVTSVISLDKSSAETPKPAIQKEPAFKRLSYLAAKESLVLPYKYKTLGEAFRCCDTIVSMMHNRKEKIVFEKLQNGVQKMTKKNFLVSHLGQILTVFPEAYCLEYEKNDSYIISNKNHSNYDLVITPILQDMNGNSLCTEEGSDKQTPTPNSSFTQMTPQLLLERKNLFFSNLTNIAKQHHQEFLKRINFPAVDDANIVRWHPKFNVDAVPDVSVAVLPEEPGSKVHTAKDVLNKIKGSFIGKVEKALESVAAEHKESTSTKTESKSSSIKKPSSALKGICTDLLEKIRARESAKLLETMTRSVEDENRDAMIQRLPKIVHIIWHCFIAERKSAVPVDTIIEKIIHSFNSLATPESVNEHLKLITTVMPGWLSFIKIPKGVYITMDKTKDINELIAAIK